MLIPFSAPSITSSSALIAPRSTELQISGAGFNPTNPSQNNQVSVRVNDGTLQSCAVQDSGSNATSLKCILSNSTILDFQSGTVYATVRSFYGKSVERAIGTLGNPDAANGGANNNNQSAIIGGAVGGSLAFIIIVGGIIFFIVYRRIQRRVKRDAKGRTVDVPKEMASMFNIKADELEIMDKLGEGSFGAVYVFVWRHHIMSFFAL
jgi:hypothetical protein